MKKMSDDEFEKQIHHMREIYVENHDKSDLRPSFNVKSSFFDRFRSLESQKAKLRRQLSELEIKRCRATLDKKSDQKLDQKLALKKALYTGSRQTCGPCRAS